MKSRLIHWLTAKSSSGYGVHSPFTYNFTVEVLHKDQDSEVFRQIEKMRKALLKSEQLVQATVPGTAEPIVGKRLKIRKIAAQALCRPTEGRLLNRLANYMKPGSIIEIGTSLGISTLYLAMANPETLVVSLEGNEEVAMVARKQFENSGINNIDLMTGEFSDTLPQILSYKLTSPFLAFIDGNHYYEPTIRYFNMLKKVAGDDSIFVFHDIHWSEDMERAWRVIGQDAQVNMTIDLYSMGLVFFKSGLSKQHYKFRL